MIDSVRAKDRASHDSAGITGWSVHNLEEGRRHERQAQEYRATDDFYQAQRQKLAAKYQGRFIVLYKNGDRIGGVIGEAGYERGHVADLNRRFLGRDTPSNIRMIRK